jgi:membrane peptidoglycan carboxypeptidase
MIVGALVLLLLSCVGLVGGAVWWNQNVIQNPGAHIDEDHIQTLIAQESPVLYSDAETRIGVFFSEEHRIYVPYEDIPKCWVDAIVAAEDKNFWDHGGVDPEGLARAMKQNVQARGVVAGGSTLTMQTSENLFHPGTRDLAGKSVEILDAWRLERHFSKEKIIEFYANQFHVYGNGRGVGIGAVYFFDKDLLSDAAEDELTLNECAFLAGLVKIPGRYNPFIGDTPDKRAEAETKAIRRTNYVLDRMLEEGTISAQEHTDAYNQPLNFKRGQFRYDSNVLMDEVERQLEEEPIASALRDAGIDNPATSGIRIVTTLDAEVQTAATYGLWHHLSSAGTSLEGLSPTDFAHPADMAPKPNPNDPPSLRTFRYGTVVSSSSESLVLDLAGHTARVDRPGLDRAAEMVAVAGKGDRYAKGSSKLREDLAATLGPGTVVWVSVREQVGESWVCDLEVRPELQGAVVVLDEGRVRALVGGNDNQNFNRATTAKRQLGSTWKVLVYHAAFQLGWTPTDVLDNRRSVFPFTGTWYYPRPDHQSEDYVSVAWAGVRSENLATIWLLYHLTDRLNPEQVRRLAEVTGLSKGPNESRQDYIERIRDQHGIISTRDRIDDAAFGAVKEQVIAGLAFTGHPEDAAELRSLHYGRGFSKEAARVARDDDKRRAVDANFLRLEGMLEDCAVQVQALTTAEAPVDPAEIDRLWVRFQPGGFDVACADVDPAEWGQTGWRRASEDLNPRLGLPGMPPISTDPLVDGRLHASTVVAMRKAITLKANQLDAYDPYDPEILYLHPDFRLVLGMRYLSGLAKEMGVEQELDPVLSMPLGAVDITLLEAAGMYEGFLGGDTWQSRGVLVEEIRDRKGKLIWRSDRDPTPVVDPVSGVLVQDILRNVVDHGTGRRALRVKDGLPLGGKTGTTNDFKNAAFVGHVPKPDDKGRVMPGQAYTLAVYVGYDDNRRMARNNIRLAGASGALPAWMGTVDSMRVLGELNDATEPLETDRETVRVPVLDKSGLVGGWEDERTVLIYGDAGHPVRRFVPYGETKAQELESDQDLPPATPEDDGPWEESPWQDPVPDEPTEPADTGIDPRIEPQGGGSIWDNLE